MVSAATTSSADRARELNIVVREQRSLWKDAMYRLFRNKAAVVGLVIVLLSFVLALFAPWIAPHEPTNVLIADGKQAPTLMEPFWGNPKYVDSRFPLGTDTIGRDNLSRLIWGTRVSLIVGFVPVAVIFIFGVTIGMVSGYAGGWLDNLLMRITDVIYAFPDLLFIIIIVATLRNTWLGDLLNGLVLLFVAVAVVNWVGMARLVRGQVLSLKEKEFVEAARTVGARPQRIMFRHLFPNALAPVIIAVAFGIPSAMLSEATLGFLGIGIKPPMASWGVMINEGFTVFSATPWAVLMPAVCISVLMLAFTFLGDGLRDALDPRMKL